jgi:hypothetical protein
MLPHGAKHLGGRAVPAIRVGAGGHRPLPACADSAFRSCKGDRAAEPRCSEGSATHIVVQVGNTRLGRRGGGGRADSPAHMQFA